MRQMLAFLQSGRGMCSKKGEKQGNSRNVPNQHILGSNELSSSPNSILIRSPLSVCSPLPLSEELGPYPRIQDPARLPVPFTPDAEGLTQRGDRGDPDSGTLQRPPTHPFSGDWVCPWWPTLCGTLAKQTHKVPILPQHPSRLGRHTLNGFTSHKMSGRHGC